MCYEHQLFYFFIHVQAITTNPYLRIYTKFNQTSEFSKVKMSKTNRRPDYVYTGIDDARVTIQGVV
jgi:phage protein U